MSVKDGPGEGSWSVFAEKVVAERDKLRDELAQRTLERDQARRAAEMGNGSWIWGDDGDDDLSSLSDDAQVSIRAGTLRKLLQSARDSEE